MIECRRTELAELEEIRLIGNVRSALNAACALVFGTMVGKDLAVDGVTVGT